MRKSVSFGRDAQYGRVIFFSAFQVIRFACL
jgi:hypothetical protein